MPLVLELIADKNCNTKPQNQKFSLEEYWVNNNNITRLRWSLYLSITRLRWSLYVSITRLRWSLYVSITRLHWSLYLSIYLPGVPPEVSDSHLSISIYLSIYQVYQLPIYLSIYQVYQQKYPPPMIPLSIYLSIYLFISIYLSTRCTSRSTRLPWFPRGVRSTPPTPLTLGPSMRRTQKVRNE